MDKLPLAYEHGQRTSPKRFPFQRLALFLVLASTLSLVSIQTLLNQAGTKISRVPMNANEIVQRCRQLNDTPGPPDDFHRRVKSDRFVEGTHPVLLKNATIWTGRVDGYEAIVGDLLLHNGLIKAVGEIEQTILDQYVDLVRVEVGRAWITPGIVDMHSHIGVDSVPELDGSSDTNSRKGLVLPWMRSLDGLNTHDEAYKLSISGGITTALVLPGSADDIGGQAFTIKLRPTSERSASSLLLEPPYTLNGSFVDPSLRPRWRQMKHACGENPRRVYSGTRMDNIWAFRQAYDTARKIKQSQDDFCVKALAGEWDGLGSFPEDLQWEALVDVLRGHVKVHTHCYEATDLDGLVRISNEFKFPIAAFHHAHETYLVPDLLKNAYGHTPGIAMFATNSRYKREAYRGSEFAPRILADKGFQVVMKSDHPVLNSRHLIYEAQQAHYYGLPAHLALAAVTSTPAKIVGLGHRIGFIKDGFDADIVIWDSHPLALGATPKQVYIDGIPQLDGPSIVSKPKAFQRVPSTPNFDKEAADAVKYDGLPPLGPLKSTSDAIIFTNVSNVFLRCGGTVQQVFSAETESGVVVVENGTVRCVGVCDFARETYPHAVQIDLAGGSISPSLLTYGSPLGLVTIPAEPSTNDGNVPNPIAADPPTIVEGSIIRAIDGLQYTTRDALIAYRAGVTTGVVAPSTASGGFLAGLSVAFSTSASHKLEHGAVIQDIGALHVTIANTSPSVSTHIAALRNLIFGGGHGELARHFRRVIGGDLPLVVTVESADIMASLIQLKQDAERYFGKQLHMTFSGASEAHLLAEELGKNGVGVILTSPRPFPATWQSRRILPGPPLSPESAVVHLLKHNVTVGIGVAEQWDARNLRFNIGWVALEANGTMSRAEAYALGSTNLEKLLGVHSDSNDLVATMGGSLLDFHGKVAGIISPHRGIVDFL